MPHKNIKQHNRNHYLKRKKLQEWLRDHGLDEVEHMGVRELEANVQEYVYQTNMK